MKRLAIGAAAGVAAFVLYELAKGTPAKALPTLVAQGWPVLLGAGAAGAALAYVTR